jgi:hypothetical protein
MTLPEVIKNAREPETILRAAGRNASRRKVSLFSIACCRRISSRLPGGRLIPALEAVENMIDFMDPDTARTLVTMRQDVRADLNWARTKKGISEAELFERHLTSASLGEIGRPQVALSLANQCVIVAGLWPSHGPSEQEQQAHLARDIFSGVWCAGPMSSCAAAFQIAEAAFVTRNFETLPILADCLEEAGCNRPEVLDHCRTPGTHARGCWVVDLTLGKV